MSDKHQQSRPLAACTRCHERKVKCDVSNTGLPCSNCSKDKIECSLRTRKSYAGKDVLEEPVHATSSLVYTNANVVDNHFAPRIFTSEVFNQEQRLTIPNRPRKRRKLDTDDEHGAAHAEPKRSTSASVPGSSMLLPEVRANAVSEPTREDRDNHVTSPLFVGDPQSIAFDVEASSTQHLFVDQYIARILGPEELEYLSKKGVFTLPMPHVIQSLLYAYFRHVHPMMPVVDSANFLKTYENDGVQSLNLLLLWSIFSAAASFVDDATLIATGFNKRKALKESLFLKAKSLFDIGSERDKTILIQSATLLSLWFVDIQDVFQTWHWSGIAINMSLNLGLHRNPDFWRKNPSFSGRRRQLWRRIWWTCVLRDRWTSLSLGRPLRITLEDCDVPFPQESDMTAEINDLSEPVRKKYGLFPGLARYWLCLLQLTTRLGEVITLNYRPKSQIPSQQQINRLETAINSCIPPEMDVHPLTLDESFYIDHLKLHREVILIVLYRRYIKKANSSELIDEESSRTRFNSREKIKAAAARCNSIVEHIVESNTTHFITAPTIPLFAPPMTSHLMEAKSLSGVAKKLATQRLDVFLTMLSEFEDNYPTAAMLKVVYLAVRDKKESNLSQELIELRRSDQTYQYHRPITNQSSSASQLTSSSYAQSQNRQQIWDDIWLLEPFANFHWDALTPESDHVLGSLNSDGYPAVQGPTPAASVMGTQDR